MSKPRETLGPPTSAGFYEDPPEPPTFASKGAADLWEASGRPALGEPSGKTGYTVADVEAATEED